MATEVQAKRAIAVLLAAYPSSSRTNEEAMTQFVRILERALEPYPAEVLAELVNPRTGIVSECDFLPSVSQIKRWCDLKWDKLMPRAVDDRSDEMKQLYGPADVETPEEREARRAIIKQKFKELLADLELATAMNSMRK